MKLPTDSKTIPWMSESEIPAIKMVLSAWREFRKNKDAIKSIKDVANVFDNPKEILEMTLKEVAYRMETIAELQSRLSQTQKH